MFRFNETVADTPRAHSMQHLKIRIATGLPPFFSANVITTGSNADEQLQ